MGRGKAFLKILICYLVFFLAATPGLSPAAVIDSAATSDQGVRRALVEFLVDAGVARPLAQSLADKAAAQGNSEIYLPVRIGAGVQYPDQDVSAELVVVLVLMGGLVGLGAWAVNSSTH